jgi:toxin ParE1/3/4
MTAYLLAPLAKADLDEIWLYVARQAGLETADRVLDSITDRFPMLARMPAAGRARDEIERGTRSFAAGDYLIFYRKARRSGIVIARVLHGARDPHKAWEKQDR